MRRIIWSRIYAELKLWFRAAPPGMFVLLVVILIRMTGNMQSLELIFLDKMLYLRPPEQLDERVVIVGIDAKDIESVKQYPIPDGKIAELLTKLESYQPRAIGLDLFKNVPVQPGAEELARVLRGNTNIIGIEKILPPEEVAAHKSLSAEQVGFADLLNDEDSKFRRYLLYTPDPKNPQNPEKDKYSLALRLVNRYFNAEGTGLETGINDPDTIMIRNQELPQISSHFGGYVDVNDGGLSILINFRNHYQPFPVVSLRDVLSGKVGAESLRDRIILVGNRNMSAGDIFYTSAVPTQKLKGQIYGVEYHAHVVSEILSYVIDNRPMLNSWEDSGEYIWIIFWGFMPIALGRLTLSVWFNYRFF